MRILSVFSMYPYAAMIYYNPRGELFKIDIVNRINGNIETINFF